MHQEREDHSHPQPRTRLGILPLSIVGAIIACAAILAIWNRGESGKGGGVDLEQLSRFRRGVSLLEQYDYLSAYQEFAEVAKVRSGWEAAHFNAGLAALNFRKDETLKKDYLPIAEAEFRETLRINPSNLHARFSLAVLLKHQQRMDEAFQEFQAVARADPNDPFVLYEYGAMLADRGKFPEAQEALEGALRLQPSLASALYKLGQVVYRNLKNDPKRVEALNLFQALTSKKEGILSGNKYGEAGKYLSVIQDPFPPEKAAGASPISGKPSPPQSGGEPPPRSFGGPTATRTRPGGRPAPPAFSVGDLDGDGILDLVLCGQPAAGGTRAQVWKGEGSGAAFKEVSTLEADGVASALGDLDGDGDPDLVLAAPGALRVFDDDGKGGFSPSKMKFPQPGGGFPLQVLIFDADSDWDLDILVLRQLPENDRFETAVELLNSNRDGSFEDIAGTAKIARLPLRAGGAIFADLDGDIDADILIFGENLEDSLILRNDRAWRYTIIPVKDLGGIGAVLSRAGLPKAVEDALKAQGFQGGSDGSLAAICDLAGRPLFLKLRSGGPLEVIGAGPAPASWIGFDLLGKKDPEPGLAWANLSGAGSTIQVKFGERSKVLQTTGAGVGGATGPLRTWFELEGYQKVDYVRILWPDSVLQSEYKCRYPMLNPKEKKDGGGAEKGDGAREASKVIPCVPDHADPDLVAGVVHRIEEKQRKPTSCPIVFAWDGNRFRYVADLLGVGGLGYLEAPGFTSKPDPTEVLELPDLRPAVGTPGGSPEGPEISGGSVSADAGEYRISILEPLEECAYLDALELVIVDAPGDLTIHPEELFPVRASAPQAKLLAFREALFPDRSLDGGGRDLTAELRAIDRIYAGGWSRDRRFPGSAEPHSMILEWNREIPAGPADPGPDDPRPVLFLYGYVEYGYSTSNFAAAQARVSLHAPTVSAERGGEWTRLLEEWGFPAGTPKWMALDLGGRIRPGDRRLRIDTDMEIYFDQAFLAAGTPLCLGEIGGADRSEVRRIPVRSGAAGEAREKREDVRVTVLIPDTAELRFRGFPRDRSPDGLHPKIYEYDDVAPEETMKPFPGRYTNYGDVADLLSSADDRFAILGEGDEVLLGFRAGRVPPLSPGCRRTFFLGAFGYCKDMDLYTAASDRVEPLPFRSMSAYPPPPGENHPWASIWPGESDPRAGRVVKSLDLKE